MNAEHGLKERIGRILSLGGFEQTRATDELKEQIIELFREYNHASEEKKEDVYLRGEKRIVDAVNVSCTHVSAPSSN